LSACETGEPGYVCVPADVRAVHDEDDGVAGGVVGLPEVAHCELPADVPDLEVHVGQGYNRDVLADCGDCFAQGGGGIGGGVCGVGGDVELFDAVEEGGFAGVVEAKEEDGVFWKGRA
jgi:hypothetical protein